MKKQIFFDSIFIKRFIYSVFLLLTTQPSFSNRWNIIGVETNIPTKTFSKTSSRLVGKVPCVVYGENKKLITSDTDVSIIDNASAVTLNNGIVKATINKYNGTVTSLIYNGLEMIKGGYKGGSIYWSWNMPNYQNPTNCTYSLITDPKNNNFNSVEIKLHMNWDGSTSKAAMDVDIYYSLQRNVSGLYASATLSHPASYPANPGGEWRMASYPNPRFDWLSVDSLRNLIIPSGSAGIEPISGAPPENYLIKSGPFTNKYECKYDYSADIGETDAWGWISTADNVGIWITTPSKEYYPGGPMKRELMCHQSPVLLNMFGGTHYSQGNETAVAEGEDWKKTYGPFLIYCNKVPVNTKKAPIALWENAKQTTKSEQLKWPYDWHNNVNYVKENGRGTVTGKLIIKDPGNPSASAADTWIGLAIPPVGSSNDTDFQSWSKNYQFWVKTDINGNFTIPHVLPGTYNLFAFGPGANGQLSLSKYTTVTAGSTINLGDIKWTPKRIASTIWEIGKPDRNAMEFKHGTDWWTSNTFPDPRWGIFMNYTDEFPKDVNFTIGKSNIATDWNFVQPYNTKVQRTSPKWNIKFNLPAAPKTGSNASVYVALAAIFNASLIVSVNDTNVTAPSTGFVPSKPSSAMIRKGIHGAFNENYFTFPAKYLRAGANQISFTLGLGRHASGEVMYDYVRLEADLCLTPRFTYSPKNRTITTTSHNAVVKYKAIASNNPTYSYVFTGATTGSGTGTGSGTKFNKGTTHVVITATNSCGNTNSSFDILVSNSTKPATIAPQNVQIKTTNNNPVAGVQLGTPQQGITPINTAPVAVADSITVAKGGTATSLTGGATSILTNDTDNEKNTLTAVLVSNVTHGTLTLNRDGTFSYVHDGSETTADNFSYKANDGTVDSNIVTVTITIDPVNDAPSGLSYTNPNVFKKDRVITSLNPSASGGAVVSYSINPSLPAGLSLDTKTGVISGTPTVESQKTDYVITATNASGTTSCTISITIVDISLKVSKGFSPNGDGINDNWNIPNIVEYPNTIVRVFNTNGVQVFYSNNYQNNWNGRNESNDQELPVGSYLYQIDLGGDGTIDAQGWLYIAK